MTDRYCPTHNTRPEEEDMCVAVERLDFGLAAAEGLLQSGREQANDCPRDP